jgi:hypothetical protein
VPLATALFDLGGGRGSGLVHDVLPDDASIERANDHREVNAS